MQKCAIIMISIGRRPWRRFTQKTFRMFCKKHGYDFVLIRNARAFGDMKLPELSDSMGRRNKAVYAAKTFIAWRYMAEYGYDRVAIVDDSCSVSPDCPGLFDVVPYGTLGGTGTSEAHARSSIEAIRASRGGEIEDLDASEYMKSGLLVYSRSMVPAITPDRIRGAADLLCHRLPHQTLTYYLMKSGGVGMTKLPAEFLRLPGIELADDQRRRLRKASREYLHRAYVWAVTGAYRHRCLLTGAIAVEQIWRWEVAERGALVAGCNYIKNKASLAVICWVERVAKAPQRAVRWVARVRQLVSRKPGLASEGRE